MSRFLLLGCVFVLGGSLVNAQEVKPAAAVVPPIVPAALKPWGGVWIPQSIEYDGTQQLDADGKEKTRLAVVNNEYRMFWITDFKEMMGRRVSTAELTVDESAKTFELTIKEGVQKGNKVHGTYEISGETLKLCYGTASRERPKAFAAPKGSGLFNEVWTKEKK